MAALFPCAFWWEMWTSVTKPLGTASTWGEWYPLTLSKNVMLRTRLISARSVSRAVRASVLLETRRGMQSRNNAIISLFPTNENKLLSHQTFEITEKYTRRAVPSSASRAQLLLSCLAGGQAAFSAPLPLQKEAAFTPAESPWCQQGPSCLRWQCEGRRGPRKRSGLQFFPSEESICWHMCSLFTTHACLQRRRVNARAVGPYAALLRSEQPGQNQLPPWCIFSQQSRSSVSFWIWCLN